MPIPNKLKDIFINHMKINSIDGNCALVISTEEVFKVVRIFKKARNVITTLIDDGSSTGCLDKKVIESSIVYTLSNGINYSKDEVIIGIDNIRDYKLGKLFDSDSK